MLPALGMGGMLASLHLWATSQLAACPPASRQRVKSLLRTLQQCREMVAHPDVVSGHRVLEIGSGCGGCGILAAKLGAAEVVLTDYSDPVLRNLQDCLRLNAAGASAANGATHCAANNRHAAVTASTAAAGENDAAAAAAAEQRRQMLADAEAWDPEDASECGSDDFDDLVGEALGGSGRGAAELSGAAGQAIADPSASWDVASPCMRIRYYDWQDSFAELDDAERAALLRVPGVPQSAAVAPGASIDTASNDSGAPGLGTAEQFDIIIGTDILYEW